MFRHFSSFSVSLLVHVTLISLIFFSYKFVYTTKSETHEKVVCVKLCCVVESEAPKQIIKKTPEKALEKPTPKVEKIKPTEVKKSIPLQETPKIEQNSVLEEMVVPEIEEVQEEEPLASISSASQSEPTVEAKSEQEEQKSVEELYIDENLQKIIQLLQENLYYPRQARKRGIVGEVVVRFYLSAISSEVSQIEVLSSESEILSRAAIETIENLSGKFPRPNEDLVLSIPITYSLKEAN